MSAVSALLSWSPMAFSQDQYLKALHFAARAHGQQKTPTGMPYVVHVTSVAMEVIAALHAEPGRDGDLAVACALLHDVVEDTAITLEQVVAAFGPRVAAGVSALTKDSKASQPGPLHDGEGRQRRMAGSGHFTTIGAAL
jgi:(p)ppGpp synthase/HD superfamily hydrolase